MISKSSLLYIFLLFIVGISCSDSDGNRIALQLASVKIGDYNLDLNNFANNTSAPLGEAIIASFSAALDVASVSPNVQLKRTSTGALVPLTLDFLNNNATFSAIPDQPLLSGEKYELYLAPGIRGMNDEFFSGVTIEFVTEPETLDIISLTIAGLDGLTASRTTDVPCEGTTVEIVFSDAVDPATATSENILISGTNVTVPISVALSDENTKVTLTMNQKLRDLTRYQFRITNKLKGKNQEGFQQFAKFFYTAIDPTPDFPTLTDDELLTKVQQTTFKYFWDFADPGSGMARERNTSGNIVTSGGTGFGIMAIIVGIERNFITRAAGVARLDKIVSFLETADRFHGVWSHWIDGNSGDVVPFSARDDGGDLVETSFLVQGLITFRQYLQPSDTAGNNLINRINALWKGVEWDWYRRNNEQVLYWHWSPNFDWDINFPLYGYFEEQITYVLAAASPLHGIPKSVYVNGYGKNGDIKKGNIYYGYTLPLESPSPLFWVHYSYLGLDPHFKDDFADYWEQNVNATLINQAYCIDNPKDFVGYSDSCWGLTASDNQNGYAAHSPSNDLGVIAPTAALSSFPYAPAESMKALKFFYYTLGDRLWGEYGFYDAFNLTEGWTANSYLAIDQGPIIIMIENYRTGLLWNLFMSSPEMQQAKSVLDLQ